MVKNKNYFLYHPFRPDQAMYRWYRIENGPDDLFLDGSFCKVYNERKKRKA